MKGERCPRQTRELEWELTALSIPSAFQMWITSWGLYKIENVSKERGSFLVGKPLLLVSNSCNHFNHWKELFAFSVPRLCLSKEISSF